MIRGLEPGATPAGDDRLGGFVGVRSREELGDSTPDTLDGRSLRTFVRGRLLAADR